MILMSYLELAAGADGADVEDCRERELTLPTGQVFS